MKSDIHVYFIGYVQTLTCTCACDIYRL